MPQSLCTNLAQKLFRARKRLKNALESALRRKREQWMYHCLLHPLFSFLCEITLDSRYVRGRIHLPGGGERANKLHTNSFCYKLAISISAQLHRVTFFCF